MRQAIQTLGKMVNSVWLFNARAKREKQNKNLKFLIRFFVCRNLFPSCFSTNETPEKLLVFANIFGSDQKHFCWKKHFFSLIFWFRHQFFLCYKTFDLNTWRNELNLQKQTKNVHNIWKDIMFIKKSYCKVILHSHLSVSYDYGCCEG